MPNYAVRVELRGNPSYETYEKLHALLKSYAFLQTVKGADNKGNQKMFSLPHATYYGTSTKDCGAVRDTLSAAIKSKIQDSIIIFVVQSEHWALGW